MTEWKTYKLGDIAEVQTGPFGSQLHNKDYALVGSPIVTVEHLGNRHFTAQNLPLVSDTDKARLSKYILSEGDIVFSRVGSVDRCSYVSDKEVGWLFSGRCLRVRCNREVYPLYIYYYFCLESVKQYIRNVAVGATMPSINTQIMSEIPISLPSLEEQRRIAGILGAIDDKIECNRRINANLELQAQALFDKWCESCSKNITIKELADNILDYTPNANSEVVLLNSSDVTQGVFAKLPLVSNVNLKGQFKKRFQKGDILYSEIRPRNKHYAYCYFDSDRYIASTRLIVLRGKKEKIVSNTLLYQYLISQNVFEEFTLKTETRSGTFPQGNYQDLSSIVVPYSDNQREIAGVLDSIYKRIWHNNTEIETLTTLRDTLLPKLMNGEIKVAE